MIVFVAPLFFISASTSVSHAALHSLHPTPHPVFLARTFIFLLKPLIIGTIFMYEKERDAEMYADGNYGKMDDAGQGMEDNDEIAE